MRPDDAAAEERLLAAIMLAHRMPTGGTVSADDFAVELHARIFEGLFGLSAVGRRLDAVELYKRNRSLDPVEVCRVISTFAIDDGVHSWLIDSYAVEVATRARRRRGQEAAA